MKFNMNYTLLSDLFNSKNNIVLIKDMSLDHTVQKSSFRKMQLPKYPIIEQVVTLKPVEDVPKETKVNADKKLIALTFDDGPSQNTDKLLKLLYDNKCKATFFVSGNNIRENVDILKRIDTYGNQIGNLGYTHIPFTNMSIEDINIEIATTYNMLLDLGIHPTNIVRPPFGKLNETIKKQVHAPFVLWNIDPEDWKYQDKNRIVNIIKDNIIDGSIILLHDQYQETIEALQELIPFLQKQGYEFVTINEMYKQFDVALKPGMVYAKIKNN